MIDEQFANIMACKTGRIAPTKSQSFRQPGDPPSQNTDQARKIVIHKLVLQVGMWIFSDEGVGRPGASVRR